MTQLESTDKAIFDLLKQEEARQRTRLRLIPSENYASRAILEATGSVFTNKYSEGYAGKRYYEGQEYVDQVERLAIERAKALFGADHANVQPYSGSPANMAVYFAFCDPGDTIMGMSLPHGGHLTHGWKVSITGKYYRAVQYTVEPETALIDYDKVRDMALAERPKLIFAGATAYPRLLDFAKFGEIAREAGSMLVADIAHISGLVAAGVHPSPVPHADVVSSTTHKMLRGPRGAFILCREEHQKAIDRAVFPGLQGGPHNHTTAAIAVALKEASTPEFAEYAQQVVRNAKALAAALLERGFDLVSGGTDNHLILIDMTNKGHAGKVVSQALNRAGIVCNSNTVPYDPRKPFDPSGIRIGTPAITSRGMKEQEMANIAGWMDDVVENIDDEAALDRTAAKVAEFCRDYPPPGLESD